MFARTRCRYPFTCISGTSFWSRRWWGSSSRSDTRVLSAAAAGRCAWRRLDTRSRRRPRSWGGTSLSCRRTRSKSWSASAPDTTTEELDPPERWWNSSCWRSFPSMSSRTTSGSCNSVNVTLGQWPHHDELLSIWRHEHSSPEHWLPTDLCAPRLRRCYCAVHWCYESRGVTLDYWRWRLSAIALGGKASAEASLDAERFPFFRHPTQPRCQRCACKDLRALSALYESLSLLLQRRQEHQQGLCRRIWSIYSPRTYCAAYALARYGGTYCT